MAENLPILNIELCTGVFRIRTADAVYQISVSNDSSLGRMVSKVVEKETIQRPGPQSAPIRETSPDEPFFKKITQDMYEEIGRLARQLSLNITEIPAGSVDHVDIEKTGVQLEDAKGQLEKIVQMTEKATMDIMDLAENIQEETQTLEQQLTALTNLDFMHQRELEWDDFEAPQPTGPTAETLLRDNISFVRMLIEKENGIKQMLEQIPSAEAVVEEAPPTETGLQPPPAAEPAYVFDVDVVFQTLYEMCTNETVKDHLKAMRADQKTAFDCGSVAKSLADQSQSVEKEDNFFNFSVPVVLRTLFQATSSEKHKAVLKKMNQTVGTIFLDPILPIEGVPGPSAPVVPEPPKPAKASSAPAPEPGFPASAKQEMIAAVGINLQRLREELSRLEAMTEKTAQCSGETNLGPEFAKILKVDQQKIIESVERSHNMVQRILQSITRILEALSFQDLSGQRILKIVRLISDVQVQLLSLLVSFGAQMKIRQEKSEEASIDEVRKLAQDDVDKMLQKIIAPSKLKDRMPRVD